MEDDNLIVKRSELIFFAFAGIFALLAAASINAVSSESVKATSSGKQKVMRKANRASDITKRHIEASPAETEMFVIDDEDEYA